MITDKINDIIEMLMTSTESGDLVWTNTKNDSQYKSERKLITKSEDGESNFEVDIKFILNDDKWYIESSASLWIKNQSLPGGSMYLTSHKYPELIKLRDTLRKKYCNDMSPSTQAVEENLSKIFKGISKSSYRDNVITKIFGK